MKIIILGAGEVGGNLAQNLTKEASDITVIDKNADRLRELQDRFDIQTIHNITNHPNTIIHARMLREMAAGSEVPARTSVVPVP